MSVREYGTFGRGLIIPDPLIEKIARQCKEWDDEAYGDDPNCFFEENRTLEGKQVLSFTECSGDFFDLDDINYKFFKGEEVDEEYFFIIELDKQPSLYKQAYKDEDEVVEEYKKSVGKYFPEDFDYKKYLVSYHGTYWG